MSINRGYITGIPLNNFKIHSFTPSPLAPLTENLDFLPGMDSKMILPRASEAPLLVTHCLHSRQL